MGLAQVLHDFANWSTVCGVPHIANARTRAWRVFWSVVFICMFSMFVYQLYTMIVKFISFPSNVNTEIFFKEQAFPVVTVCNSNPYKLSAILNQSNNLDTIKHLMDVYVGASSKSLTASDEYGLYELMNTDYEKEQRAWDALALEAAQLGEEQLNPALYTFGELITDCTFSGKKCSAADFTRIVDPIYGACYSFNEDSTLSYSTSRAGMKFGLKLLITVSQQTTSMVKDFLPTTKMAGARVAIHPRGVHAALDNNGINVGVGYQTAISLVSTRTQRLKEPYGKCVDTEPDATNLYKSNVYTLETCFYNCRQRETIKQCSCANPRFKKADSQQWCLPTKVNLDCLTSLRGDQASTTPNISPLQDCSCGPPCSETSYLTTASISKFPAEDYFVATDPTQGVAGSCDNQNPTFNQDPRRCREWYAKNALLLQVFFETLKYESYTEVPSYGISPALNDLGGQAGLWLGLSVISVIEVCALIMMLILYCVTCGRLKIRPDDGELEEDERIKDIGEVKKELDHADRHDKAMEEDDDIDIEDEINDNNNEKKAE
uniref:Amiloride-sensitive sodium channel n=1 Tax=Haemonchus contortus TaxID=6289 RepID=A0A7I4XWR2_HAECO|nr:Na+ channel domain containing protein [Haemonchus contortus]